MLRAVRDHDIAQRRVCFLVGVDPKTVRRERPSDNPEIRTAMQEIAALHRRFCFRRIGLLGHQPALRSPDEAAALVVGTRYFARKLESVRSALR